LIPHIFAIRADGSGLTQLTSGTSVDTQPAVSPDGTTIAFTSDRAGTLQIFTMDVATRAIKQITSGSDPAREAAFSPDGTTIAFNVSFGLSLVATNGTNLLVATVTDGCGASPRGAAAALEITTFTSTAEYCGGRLGSSLNLGKLAHPSWGPGTFIVLSDSSNGGFNQIIVLDVSNPSFEPILLVKNDANQENPTWAPSTFVLTPATDGGASGCDALAACCGSLGGGAQSLCTSVAASADAANCAVELAQLQGAGSCTGS